MAADSVQAVNDQLVSSITNAVNSGAVNNVIGWIVLAIFIIGASIFGYITWQNKKAYSKKCTILEVVGINYVPTFVDMAKVVKLGTGGFEILHLKKLNTWKIAFGGRVGKDNYYFFVGKDGYWYNGMLSADIYSIDQHKGLIPITVTNATMRAQYTSLEKQIDTLHSEKKSFMDKYGMWVLGAGFMLIIGVFFWLIAREVAPIMSSIGGITDKQAILTDQMTTLLTHLNQLNATASNNGLVALR